MPTQKRSPAQLCRLMTVYNQLASREIGMATTREARMAWASGLLQRPVDSFNTLTLSEATHLIDQAQGQLGVVAPLKKQTSAREARRAGVDGRNCAGADEFAKQPAMVTTEDMEMIVNFRDRLGWSQADFEQWLTQKRSPLKGRKQIRTAADANRVIWGLKGMLKGRKLWNEVAA